MLRFLSAHNHVIDSLTVDNENAFRESQVLYEDFKGLNFSAPRWLTAKEVDVKAMTMIMDLALQSNQEVALDLGTQVVGVPFLKHGLLQNTKTLVLNAEVEETFTLPDPIILQASEVKLGGNRTLLEAFDSRNCRSLRQCGPVWAEEVVNITRCLPEQVVESLLINPDLA